MPMLDARRAKKRPPGARTRHISSTMRSKWARSRAKCRTALHTTASIRPSGHGSAWIAPWRMLSAGSAGRQRGGELARRGHRAGVLVDRVNLEPAREKIRQVASGAAARVEHAPPRVETAPQQLIEQVDVDLPELRAQLGGGRRRGSHRRPTMAALMGYWRKP